MYTPLLIHRCVIHLRNGACRVTRASSVGFRACNASDRTVRRVSTIVAVAVVASCPFSSDHPTGKSCAHVRLCSTTVRVRARVCVCVHVYVCSLCRVGGRGIRVPRCRLRESNLIVCVRRESLPRVTCSVTRKMRRSSGNAF